jgi:ribonucleotide reductase beta subunit family protein with ferritin-like domain
MAAQANSQKGATAGKATFTKTGNSRVIAGYKCDEYKVIEAGKEGYSNVWMTNDVKLKADKKYWSQSGLPSYYNNPEFAGGMLLAMEEFDKNNKPVMKMETKEINEKFPYSISTVGYTFMKMNFGQAGKK